ncbi:hypothetical protein CTEN210_06078 [Chaetoceros tenuissimus]|uniref:tRNA (guanine(37)-N1)-methyltransferase n=1 Tax=Chaetoceros tenuissimus TaxID=426638 RepID=A0AAD3CP66_9STRA|nr:hypothetical protein CTEN210_06078 [Chaetoceros tenuissimus]
MTISIPIPIPKDEDYVYPVSHLDLCKPLISTTITHPAIIIPAKLTSSIRADLKKILMNRPKMRDIYALSPEVAHSDASIDPKTERKVVLTNSNSEYPGEKIFQHPAIEKLFNDTNQDLATVRKSSHDVVIGYDHFTVEEVLSKLLPKEHFTEIPSSFEVIGHLAHITLREEYNPYKYIIGRAILDKNKGIQVVVNKTGTIQNEFRTFPMEILADDRKPRKETSEKKKDGIDLNLLVEVKEDGCKFQLDFEKVYWNSRLQFEHRRIVHTIAGKERPTNMKKRELKKAAKDKDSDQDMKESSSSSQEKIIVADACAGIGPFAVPLTSQFDHVEVYANDLNPESYKYLEINSKLNKCNHGKKVALHTYNMDGRYFLRKLDEDGIKYDHVLMNLPAIAPEFLNVFRGWKGDYNHRPMVHVHCFAAKVGGEEEAVKRCGRNLGCELDMDKDEVYVHEVRNVSPKKNMYCVSFRLPEGVKEVEQVQEFGAIVSNENDDEDEEPPSKKLKA